MGCLNKSSDKNKIISMLMKDGRALAGVKLNPAQPFRMDLD